MRQIQIRWINRLATQFGVEIETAGRKAALLDQLYQCRHQLLRVVRKLVGIPAIAWIAAVDVYGAEDSVGPRSGNLVLEVQSRQRRMIDFDVDLDLLGQPVAL